MQSGLFIADLSNITIPTSNNINSRPYFPEQILSTPNSVFRSSIGLSNKKIEYIKDLSAKVIERKLDVSTLHALSDELDKLERFQKSLLS